MIKWNFYTDCTPDQPRLGDSERVHLERVRSYLCIKTYSEVLLVHRGRADTAAFLRRARKAMAP